MLRIHCTSLHASITQHIWTDAHALISSQNRMLHWAIFQSAQCPYVGVGQSNYLQVIEKLMLLLVVSQFFLYENHCKCCNKLGSRFWLLLITLTYFFFYIHSPLLKNKKCCDCRFLQQIRILDHCTMIYITRLFQCADWFQYD